MYLEYKVTIFENGRINISAKMQDQLHLSSGEQLMLIVEMKITFKHFKYR